MKKLTLIMSVVLGLFGMAASVEAAESSVLTVTMQISGLVQSMNSVTNSGIATTTYSAKMVKISNTDILDMLQTEFATTYPAGAKLGYSLETAGFVVLDKSGNQIMNV